MHIPVSYNNQPSFQKVFQHILLLPCLKNVYSLYDIVYLHHCYTP